MTTDADTVLGLTDQEIEYIRSRHVNVATTEGPHCWDCGTYWPCDTARLLATLHAKPRHLEAFTTEVLEATRVLVGDVLTHGTPYEATHPVTRRMIESAMKIGNEIGKMDAS